MARKQSPAALARTQQSLGSPEGQALGLRERLLEMAGVTEHEQATLTRAAITKYSELLHATKVQRLVVNAGLNQSEVREFADPDHAIQARAADALLDRFGVVLSKAASVGTQIGSLTVHVHKVQPPSVVIDAQVIEP